LQYRKERFNVSYSETLVLYLTHVRHYARRNEQMQRCQHGVAVVRSGECLSSSWLRPYIQHHLIRTRFSRRLQTSPPVPPPGELDKTYASSFILAYSLHYMKTWRHPQNRKYITHRNVVRGGPNHGHR